MVFSELFHDSRLVVCNQFLKEPIFKGADLHCIRK